MSKRGNFLAGEILPAALLSLAALASSYAGFQSQLWNSQQAAHYAVSDHARSAASKAETIAMQLDAVDAMLFSQWLNASASNQSELQDYYRERFRPPFRAEFERWLALRPRFNPQAPGTPFEMPGYRAMTRSATVKLAQFADAELKKGQQSNETSDRYGQAAMVLSLSLFLGGIVQTFRKDRPRAVLLALAAAIFLVGIAKILALPAIRLL